MRQSIRGYTDGLIARAGGNARRRDGEGVPGAPGTPDVASLAGEMQAVEEVFAGSEDLRRVMGDPGVPAEGRHAILRDLFESRISAQVMRLLRFTVDADRASSTVENVSWLANRLRAAAEAKEPVGDVVLGHKAAEERLDGYSTALLEGLSGERELAEVEDELFRFHRIVAASDELRQALSSREVPTDQRRRLVTELLAGKVTPVAESLASYATRVGRPRDYEDLLEWLVARVASESNRRLAEVRSAVDLDEQQQRQLTEALTRAVGHDVEVRVTVDPSVIAGFVANIGDTVVDGSARHQLELIRERLTTPEANITLTTQGERS